MTTNSTCFFNMPGCHDSTKNCSHLGQLRILNLVLFFRGREHTIVAAKDSSSRDVEIGNKHSQLVIHHGEEQELKQEVTVSACYVPVCFKENRAHKAVWFTKATVHWSNFSIFVDSVDSQIILWMIPEPKANLKHEVRPIKLSEPAHEINAGINLTGYHPPPPPRAPRGFCTKMCAQPQGFCTTENARGPGQ